MAKVKARVHIAGTKTATSATVIILEKGKKGKGVIRKDGRPVRKVGKTWYYIPK